MFRSSIFSFDTLAIDCLWFGKFLRVVLLVIIILSGIECIARALVYNTGERWRYWNIESYASFANFKKLESSGRFQKVVICGDSTGFCNIDALDLDRRFGSEGAVWNLSSPGNFALSFERSTLPVLEARNAGKSVIILSMIPAGFVPKMPTPGELGILSVDVCKNNGLYRNAMSTFAVFRLRKCLRFLFQASVNKENEIVESRGSGISDGGWGASMENDERDESPRISVNEGISVELFEKRIDVLREFLSLCRRKDWSAIIVIPPSLDVDARMASVNAYRELLNDLSADFRFDILNLFEPGIFSEEDFKDSNHLNFSGASKASRIVGDFVDRRLRTADSGL